MNKLVNLFGSAIVIFLLAFCVITLLQRNKQTFAKWSTPSERYDKEAENVSRNVDKVTKLIPKLYNKVREEVDKEDLGNNRAVSAPAANPTSEQRRSYTPVKTVSPTVEVRNTNIEEPEIAEPEATYIPPPTPAPKPVLMNVKPTAPMVRVSPNGMYQVQLGIYKKIPSYDALRHLGAIYIEKIGDQQRVYLGNYATHADANQILVAVRNLGFKDAFVKTIDNTTIITAEPAKTPTPAAATTTPTAALARKATTAPELDPKCNCPKSTEKTALPTNVFVIQLGASQFPVLGNARKLTQYGSVYKDYDAKNDLTKIMLGSFDTQTQANEALQAAKQLGFKKAFVKQIKSDLMTGWKKAL